MKILNLGIFAHIDAGKTTLTEQLLHLSGIISSPGTIEEGTTESDTLKVEIERGISVMSTLLQFTCAEKFADLKINLIDTPGHLDFRAQAEIILPAIDLAIVVIDGTRGVESQTLLLHEELERKKIPEIFFINKLDKSKDAFADCLVSLEELLHKTPNILFHEEDYHCIWKSPASFSEKEHLELLEWNEELSALYLEKPHELFSLSQEGLVKGTLDRKIFPILGGSAFFGKGVEELIEFMDFIAQELSVCGKEKLYPKKETTDKAITSHFKIIKRLLHPSLGKLLICKSYSNIYANKPAIYNGKNKKIGEIYSLLGWDYEIMECVEEGDIFSIQEELLAEEKLSDTLSGFGREDMVDSNFSFFIEPENAEDRDELLSVLKDLVWEDPGYRLEYNSQEGNWQVFGKGELHLEILKSRLEEKFRKKYNTGNMYVARYERLKRMVKKLALEHTAFDEKLSSGKLVANLRDTADFSKQIAFEVSLPEKIQNAIQTGFHESLSRGNYHLEVLGVSVVVESYEPPVTIEDSTPTLLKVAVVSGIRNALHGNTLLIGPLSDLEVEVADADVGNVLSLLQKRDAKILDIQKKLTGKSLILAQAGTENLLGFSGALRNMTKGTGISYQRNSFSPENHKVFE